MKRTFLTLTMAMIQALFLTGCNVEGEIDDGFGNFSETEEAEVRSISITSISESIGTSAGGTTFTITGSGFTEATSATVGGTSCVTLTFVNSTSLTCVTPTNPSGASTTSTVDVVVTDDGLTETLSNAFTFKYVGVTSVSTNYGTAAGGTSITITGGGFSASSTATINGTACTSLTYNSATSLTCTTPANASGTTVTELVDVAVTDTGVTGTGADLFLFLSTNRRVHYDANVFSSLFSDQACTTNITSNGDTIGCWVDQSTNNTAAFQYDANLANKPTYSSNGFNGKPGIAFDGVQNFAMGLNMFGQNNFSAVVVFTATDQAFRQEILAFNQSRSGLFIEAGGTMSARSFRAGFSDFFGGVDTVDDGSVHVAYVTYDSAANPASKLYVDSSTLSNSRTQFPDTISFAFSYIGYSPSVVADRIGNGGMISEILVFNQTLTTDEISDLETFLAAKWK